MTSSPPSADTDGVESALRMVEAMRLGVVPSSEPSAYTVGRDAETERVRGDLHRANEVGAVRTFLGDYGTGKTHMLELVRHAALRENFIVASVVLSPEGAPPSQPGHVYRALCSALTYPDAPGYGLEPLFERAVANEEVTAKLQLDVALKAVNLDEGAHLYLTPALRYFRALDPAFGIKIRGRREAPNDEERDIARAQLMGWIEASSHERTPDIVETLTRTVGNHGKIYSLKDYRPWARIYGYLLSGISTLARLCGYRGLAVLVDEAEFYALLSRENRFYAQTLFKSLALASAANPDELPFSVDELDIGGQGILQTLPARYGERPSLYTVFAMTPTDDGLEALNGAVPADTIQELSALQDADYEELVRRVIFACREARPERPLPDAIIPAFSAIVRGMRSAGIIQNPRHAMKLIIELIDIAHHNPSKLQTALGHARASLGL